MIEAFKAFFRAMVVLCVAFERFAKGLDHGGRYVEQSMGAFADQAEIERNQKIAALQASTPVALPQPTQPALVAPTTGKAKP